MNEVRVDPHQLEAEAAAVGAEAAADTVAAAAAAPPSPEQIQAAAQIEEAAEGYKLIALAVVAQGSELFVPNWHVSPAEQTDLSDAIVQALMLWFPDGMLPPKYLAILVVAGVGARIAFARRDPITGELPARHAIVASQPVAAAAHN